MEAELASVMVLLSGIVMVASMLIELEFDNDWRSEREGRELAHESLRARTMMSVARICKKGFLAQNVRAVSCWKSWTKRACLAELVARDWQSVFERPPRLTATGMRILNASLSLGEGGRGGGRGDG